MLNLEDDAADDFVRNNFFREGMYVHWPEVSILFGSRPYSISFVIDAGEIKVRRKGETSRKWQGDWCYNMMACFITYWNFDNNNLEQLQEVQFFLTLL